MLLFLYTKVNCIRDADKEYTEKIFYILYNELHARLKASPCNKIGEDLFGLSDVDIHSAVQERDPSLVRICHNLHYLNH